MRPFAPSYRAAAAALIVLTVGAITGTALHDARVRDAAEREARVGAGAAARAAAAAISAAPNAPPSAILNAATGRASGAPLLALIGMDGRLIAASGDAADAELRWELIGASAPPPEITIAGRRHLVSVVPAPRGGRLAALSPMGDVSTAGAAAIAFGFWLLCALVLAGGAWYAGPQAADRLGALASRLAAPEGPVGPDRRALVARAARALGPFAAPLDAIAEAADRAREQATETRATVAALLQINPHYVIVCTLDGTILDANPAFYAVTGLPFEGVRGNRIEVLEDVMPVEPLFDLARRSLREGSSISGIEYALVNREEQRRPVHISLRAIKVDGQAAVVIQATDVANQRTLEHQIAQFSDALDLMVDQRVAQITGGNAGLDALLDAAGVLVVEFDVGGGTRRLSRSAEALLSGQMVHVPHVTAFASRLELPATVREAFVRWAVGEGPVLMQTSVFPGGVRRDIVWRRGRTGAVGSIHERHVLIGLEVPAPRAQAAGDGASTEAALGRPADGR